MAVGFGKFQYTPLQWIYPACEECEYTHTTSDNKAIHIGIYIQITVNKSYHLDHLQNLASQYHPFSHRAA